MVDRSSRTRRKSCASCTESKIKCDRQYPCSKCASRGKDCVFNGSRRKSSASNQTIQKSMLAHDDAPSEASTTPSTLFIPIPDTTHSYSDSFHIQKSEEIVTTGASISSIPESKSFLLLHAGPVVNSRPSTSDVDTAQDSEHLLPVHSHLSSAFASDMFEPFFSSIFSQLPPTVTIAEEISWAGFSNRVDSPEEFPFATLTSSVPALHGTGIGPEVLSETPSFHPSPTLQPATSDIRHTPVLDSTLSPDPAAPELQHYCRFFYRFLLEHCLIWFLSCSVSFLLSVSFASSDRPC